VLTGLISAKNHRYSQVRSGSGNRSKAAPLEKNFKTEAATVHWKALYIG